RCKSDAPLSTVVLRRSSIVYLSGSASAIQLLLNSRTLRHLCELCALDVDYAQTFLDTGHAIEYFAQSIILHCLHTFLHGRLSNFSRRGPLQDQTTNAVTDDEHFEDSLAALVSSHLAVVASSALVES